MELIKDFLHLISSPEGIKQIISWGGILVLIGIVFAETGLLVGFFLPGDSLLFISGVVASDGTLSLWQLLIFLSMAAIVGDSVGYAIGRKAGQALYSRPQSRWFRRDYLLRTRAFYDHYGGMTIILARFIPFARTFAPTVAGIGEMAYARFLAFNVVGGILWVFSMVLMGYFFGKIPVVERNLEKVVVLIVFLSVLPVAIHALKAHLASRAARSAAPEQG
ncbi:MAG: membrane protein [Candidatus Xenobia bacterium]